MSLAALLNDNKMLGSVAFATFNLIFLVRLRTLSSLSISGASSNFVSKQSALVPIKAKKVPSKITFGVNGDEYRGENPMDPPRVCNSDIYLFIENFIIFLITLACLLL